VLVDAAAAASLWLSIDLTHYSFWLVGWCCPLFRWVAGGGARNGSSGAVVLSTILVAVSQNN
jgi:hypothetical protein